MEVYYKFKSDKDYKSFSIDWHYTTVADLKQNIYYKNCSGKRRTHYKDNLIVTNAQTNEEYLDGETLIPKNTSVIIRRVPLPLCMPIVIPPVADQEKPLAENKLPDVQATETSFSGHSSVSIYPGESEWDELWTYLSTPELVRVQSASPNKADEDSWTRALIDTPAMNRQCHNPDRFPVHRDFEPGMGGRSDRHGFGRGGLLEQITPPPGYICHRCKVPGHFIQRCPTNGDPAFDLNRKKRPTGIPKSMLMATLDGSYAVLKPKGASFEKEIKGMPSTSSVAPLPAELHCPLCRELMKDAVLASKCCFKSYCDKCIRDYIISKSLCFCGATNVHGDDLLPNKTLRASIVRILEFNNGSGANSGSSFQPQDMESARYPQPKILCPNVPSPTLVATSKEDVLALRNKGNTKVVEMTEPGKIDNNTQKILGMVTVKKGAEVSAAAQECGREPGSQICPPVTDKEMQQKQVSGEVGKTKKKKGAYFQSRSLQYSAAENYLMAVEPFGYNSYWNSMKPEIDGFGHTYGVHAPFRVQVDLAKHGTDFNCGSGGDVISHEDVLSAKSKTKSITPPDCPQPRPRSGRRSPLHISKVPEFLRSSSKREVKYEHSHQGEKEHRHCHRSESVSSKPRTNKTISDRKNNASVLSCITSQEEESAASKKRKLDSS